MFVTKTGLPVEFLLAPGGCNDCRVLKQFQLDIPENSFVFADKSYNDYSFEDIVSEAQRKKNSKRAFSGAEPEFLFEFGESVISIIPPKSKFRHTTIAYTKQNTSLTIFSKTKIYRTIRYDKTAKNFLE
ncbi:hypothetical protein [Candidatus Uabimicrobium sp. HlEnr_7]|uniref:hypothetical protein n=1 Tax=Candidatus Uabimicrobium helgolandensis TaxID=3095367 RepID=UPI00355863F7